MGAWWAPRTSNPLSRAEGCGRWVRFPHAPAILMRIRSTDNALNVDNQGPRMQRKQKKWWCLGIIPVLFVVFLGVTGCASNTLLLETRVNDPIMLNLLDNDLDLAQIEDGTGFVGEAAACPT